MRHRVIYSPRTVRDLERIYVYLTTESGDPNVSNNYLVRMLDACDTLTTLPTRYGIYPFARRWRMMPFQNYLIFFQIQKDTILIGHIRHASRRPFKES